VAPKKALRVLPEVVKAYPETLNPHRELRLPHRPAQLAAKIKNYLKV
jgi:hypothetical protein